MKGIQFPSVLALNIFFDKRYSILGVIWRKALRDLFSSANELFILKLSSKRKQFASSHHPDMGKSRLRFSQWPQI